MVKTQKTNLVDVVKAVATLKVLVAQSQDGAVVGIDSVSGDDYFQTMPSVGTIYIGKDGLHRMVVDALAYPAHRGDSGKVYADENRFLSIAFDPNTLDILPGSRRNSGFKSMASCKVLSIDPFTWVDKRMAEIAAAKEAADKAKKAQDHKRIADLRTNTMKNFF